MTTSKRKKTTAKKASRSKKKTPAKKRKARKPAGPRPLTGKQRLFVEAYMGEARGNAAEAARLAGYAGSPETLRKVGSENLTKGSVIAAIQERHEKHPLTLTREQFREELTQVLLGRASPHGESWHSGVDIITGEVLPPTSRDRLKAGEIVARVTGWNVTKLEHSGPDGGPIETKAADVGPDPKDMTPEELAELEKLSAAWADLVERVEARLAAEGG